MMLRNRCVWIEAVSNTKTLLFSVTIKDVDMQTFTVGGHGGSGKGTSNSGCRLVHRDSGAVGEGRDHRSLLEIDVTPL